MSNFSKMLEVNKASSIEKEERAKREITKMLDENIRVTVADLVSRTGLSRAFFYKNATVAEALAKAREKQQGIDFTRSRKTVLDCAMDRQLKVLKTENENLKKRLSDLERENLSLKTAMNKKTLKLIKGL